MHDVGKVSQFASGRAALYHEQLSTTQHVGQYMLESKTAVIVWNEPDVKLVVALLP